MSRSANRDFEIVVAKYNEDISWVQPYREHVTVYSKFENEQNRTLIPLPNVGRESHTYLYHIIENYNDLAKMTLFTQGRIRDIDHFKNIMIYSIEQPFIQHSLRVQYPIKNWNGRLSLGRYAVNLRHSPYSIGQWWDKYIKIRRPSSTEHHWQPCAMFSVHREVIRAHPLSYYQSLISTIDDHVNPEEGHYFERTWYHIFCGVQPYVRFNRQTVEN